MLKMRCRDKQHESAERKQLRGRRERTNGCFNREPRCEEKFICGMTPSRGSHGNKSCERDAVAAAAQETGAAAAGTVWVHLFAARNEGKRCRGARVMSLWKSIKPRWMHGVHTSVHTREA